MTNITSRRLVFVFMFVFVLFEAVCLSNALVLRGPESRDTCEWTAHSFWGRTYFHNTATHVSAWDVPPATLGCVVKTSLDPCEHSNSFSPLELSTDSNVPKELSPASHALLAVAHIGADDQKLQLAGSKVLGEDSGLMNLESKESGVKKVPGSNGQKIIPFVHKAWEPFEANSITLTLQANIGRIQSGSLNRIASQWNGPISVAILVPSHADAVAYLNEHANAAVKNWADVHVMVAQHTPHYPINRMRNIALINVRPTTKYVMVLDIDEDLPFNMQKHLEILQRSNPAREKTIFILPSFQFAIENPPNSMPKGLKELKVLFEKKQATVKHPEYSAAYGVPGLSISEWQLLSSSRDVPYVDGFEPYFVALRNSFPLFDDRFEGFGGNKASLTLRLALEGYRLSVVPQLFTWCRQSPSEAAKFRAPADPALMPHAWWELGHSHGCERCCVGCCVENCGHLFKQTTKGGATTGNSTPNTNTNGNTNTNTSSNKNASSNEKGDNSNQQQLSNSSNSNFMESSVPVPNSAKKQQKS